MKRIRRLLAQVLALSLFLAMVPAVPVHAADCNHNYVISGITAREHSPADPAVEAPLYQV